MYESLISKFKKELVFRNFNIIMLIFFLVLMLSTIIGISILWIRYECWWILLIFCVGVITLGFFVPYSVWFNMLNKKTHIKFKYFFNLKRVKEVASSISNNDVDILIKILKEVGINTRPKVNEAIRHFQMLLLRNHKSGLELISVITLAVSICAIVFSVIFNYASLKLGDYVFILAMVIIMVIVLYIGIKWLYKNNLYELSKYALIERIEAALSEIWFKQLIR